ncbi:hypothetical protein DXX93_04835 [Thalassotalea euphylliae]|uniref:Type II secretion system protein GspF domain-containing protein n=1 Tax=Thalassotalea euphylliae TaxID=1655234 RepID=A0A3E0TNF3_9GAMM|nr:type II secretion system F family protein [Thalassotalea euphylliae]REL25953.1 hypothetical protein DXX93_04835 [Thalassotalea euphylliae]
MLLSTSSLLFCLLLLIVVLVSLLAYLLYQHKLVNRQQQRLSHYLSAGQSALATSDAQALFKTSLQETGIKAWLYRLWVRLGDVFHPKLILTFMVLMLITVFTVLKLGQAWPWLAQLSLLISVNVLLFNGLYQWQLKRLNSDFEQDFPHAVATVSRAVSAGLSVNAALLQAKEQSQHRVQQVFAEITDLLAIGATLDQALSQAGIKVQQPSFKFFSVCLLLNQQSGGQLAQVLHQLMANIHERKSHHKRVLAMTAEPRVSAKVIACLPVLFLLFFYYQMPSAFDYLRYHQTGQWIAGYALASIVFGLWLINRMTKVD